MKNLLNIAIILVAVSCAHNLDSEVSAYKSKAEALTKSLKSKKSFSHIKSESRLRTAKASHVEFHIQNLPQAMRPIFAISDLDPLFEDVLC